MYFVYPALAHVILTWYVGHVLGFMYGFINLLIYASLSST